MIGPAGGSGADAEPMAPDVDAVGPADPASFAATVRRRFGLGADQYDSEARLQRSIAWRLARLSRELPLPEGPRIDLGAGSGLLSRALVRHHPQLRHQPPLQLDQCPQLLARNPLTQATALPQPAAALVWDLNDGLPSPCAPAALLASSFALQWLETPARELGRWSRALMRGGWLLLAVPTAGSFPQWHQAAARAGVPCTALALPEASRLEAAVACGGLRLHLRQRLRFSRPRHGGLPTLRHLQGLGASASRRAPLRVGEMRRLLRHWPRHTPLTWEVLLLVAQRPL